MARTVARTQQPSALPTLPQRAPRGAARGARPSVAQPNQENPQYGGASLADPNALTPMADEGVSPNLGSRPAILLEDTGTITDEEADRNAQAAPLVHRYVVEQDREVGINGHRSKLRAGKIIDSLNYDIPKLKVQGVKLRLHVEEV